MSRHFDWLIPHYMESAVIPSIPIQGGSASVLPLTFSAWISTETEEGEQVILGFYDSATSNQWVNILINSDATVQSTRRVGGGTAAAVTSTTITANKWHHVCGTLISNVLNRCYIDNRGEGADTTDILDGNQFTHIGIGQHRDTSPNRPFLGLIAELSVHNVALNHFEREQLAVQRLNAEQVRPDALVWYESFRFPDYNYDLESHRSNKVLLTNSGSTWSPDHPYGIVYPRERMVIATDLAVVGITDGEIAAATGPKRHDVDLPPAEVVAY